MLSDGSAGGCGNGIWTGMQFSIPYNFNMHYFYHRKAGYLYDNITGGDFTFSVHFYVELLFVTEKAEYLYAIF